MTTLFYFLYALALVATICRGADCLLTRQYELTALYGVFLMSLIADYPDFRDFLTGA